MLLEYWGFERKPFDNTQDPRFLYESDQHAEGMARLQYMVDEGMPAGVLTGTFGSGKTLLATSLLSRLNPNLYRVALVENPRMQPVELLRAIARKMGADHLPERLSEMSSDYFHEVIERILWDNRKDGRRSIVVIDEAHIISDRDVFEELRMLLNYQTEEGFLLTLLLVGQPELRDKIQNNKPFLQRISMTCQLGALKAQEVSAYVTRRLAVAGAARPIFTEAAMSVIAKNSGSLPRRINQICSVSLLLGAHQEVKEIGPEIVEEAARTAWGEGVL